MREIEKERLCNAEKMLRQPTQKQKTPLDQAAELRSLGERALNASTPRSAPQARFPSNSYTKLEATSPRLTFSQQNLIVP